MKKQMVSRLRSMALGLPDKSRLSSSSTATKGMATSIKARTVLSGSSCCTWEPRKEPGMAPTTANRAGLYRILPDRP